MRGSGPRRRREEGEKEERDTHRVDRTLPVLGSQNLVRLSLDPDASRPLVGCHLTHLTSQP